MPNPMIEDVLTMARVNLNDTEAGATGTPGEGRVFIDTASFILPLLNECLLELSRDLENGGVKTNRIEYWSSTTPVPPIHGALGVGVPDPGALQYLGFTGVFDGTSLNAALKLPAALLVPIKLEQRTNGTGLPYTIVNEAQSGLISAYQDATLGQWEWRGDAIWWNGATLSKDIRIRYVAGVTLFSGTLPANFPTTSIPILDSQDALSYLMAHKYSASVSVQGSADDLYRKYQAAVANLITRQVKSMQSINYRRTPYGDAGEIVDW